MLYQRLARPIVRLAVQPGVPLGELINLFIYGFRTEKIIMLRHTSLLLLL
jgi:hypothetical protein